MMNFELLPNELLLNVLKYLTNINLLCAFHGLNNRFNRLLSVYFRNHGFDFQLMSKQNFEIICQQYLLSFVDEVVSLRLSDDNDTPQQTNHFLSYGFTLNQFSHLQSLSLCHLRSDEIIGKILSTLPNLTHLNLVECYCPYNEKNMVNIINIIWSFPKLTHCQLDITIENIDYFITPTITSLSLTHVTIKNLFCNLKSLANLYYFTPHLEYVHIGVIEHLTNIQFEIVLPLIRSLNLSYIHSQYAIITFLQHMPNLRCLKIVIDNIYIDGYQWQKIIVDYLHVIEVFQLKMGIRARNNNEIQQEVDQLIDSFRSPFWIIEHQWFFRCHWNPSEGYDLIYLYTLPYAFEDFTFFSLNKVIQFKSTCSNDNDYLSYDRTHHVWHYSSSLFNNILSHIRFSYLHHLSLELPLNNYFRSIFPRFDQLISLDVWSLDGYDNNIIQSQLQMLLDWMPKLIKLSFTSWPNSYYYWPFVQIRNRSIPRLDFEAPEGSGYWQVFNSELCSKLMSSPFGIQCQTLVIRVQNRINILDLINSMNNLRAMSVRCEEDDNDNDDEIIEWLRIRLPPTCSITRDTRFTKQIRLWIS